MNVRDRPIKKTNAELEIVNQSWIFTGMSLPQPDVSKLKNTDIPYLNCSQTYSDVTLICADGAKHRTNKLQLAAVSPLMKRLLGETLLQKKSYSKTDTRFIVQMKGVYFITAAIYSWPSDMVIIKCIYGHGRHPMMN